ncbi:uncharacterized protein ATNIH1004_008208 [Aspergillus tanneri]|uniref:Uncharacterized protein n=1 Tax=Aspergillus tanneri TaxID=1220188 RepID=A0A5M9MAD6_9EURO|nr:uncharacterized protein ATNIH1004_008208 [Aspergillus tanneri]KAA8644012.1 hypothetical protein ATNIH1004_008208 [Aspergillus tanneri]
MSTQNTVLLKTQENWKEWNTQFEGLARGKNLWGIITGDEQEILKPAPPTDDTLAPPAGSTRSTNPTSLADRQFAWTVYKSLRDDYILQQTELSKLREWMQKTISPQVYEYCCDPEDSMKEWYAKLKQRVGIDDATVKKLAREAYKKAIKPVTRPRDVLTWLNNWEEAMHKAEKARIAVAATTSDWIEDFLNAVRTLNPVWATSYEIAKSKDIESDNLTFRLVAQDFRKGLDTKLIQQSSNIAKGSFGPTFDAEEAKTEGTELNHAPKGQSYTQKRKQKPNNLESCNIAKKTKVACKACGQMHEWKACFYLSSRGPKGFKERAVIRRFINHLLQTDKEFAKEVEEWKSLRNQD